MEKTLRALDTVLKALADPTRLRIVGLLSAGEVCVCHIHESLRLPQPLVSRHLAYLRRAGLVDTRKEGLWVYYRMAPKRNDVTQTMLDAASHCVAHLETTIQDGRRLEKKTGCCVTAPGLPTFACCSPHGRGEQLA